MAKNDNKTNEQENNEELATPLEPVEGQDLPNENLVQNIADTEWREGEPITDIDQAAEERVKKNKEQIQRNEELAKAREVAIEDHEKQRDQFNNNVR
jgi:hypothetical protein